MKPAGSYKVALNFNQIVQLVKQLPVSDKVKLSKELEKEAIDSKLSKILKLLKTNELTDDEITQECESVREKLYHQSHGTVVITSGSNL
jgi:hypothetical protein